MSTSEELLQQMYDSNLVSRKAALQSDYDAAIADLDAQKVQNQQQADNNVRLTKTEADRSAVNSAEYYAAAGLSSGAKAQARIAQDNQLLSDLTAIRAMQQQADANAERQRGLLSQQFAAAIRQAQADNDMARAQALYEDAKEAEGRELAAARIMADAGDYRRLAAFYGLSEAELRLLMGGTTYELTENGNINLIGPGSTTEAIRTGQKTSGAQIKSFPDTTDERLLMSLFG